MKSSPKRISETFFDLSSIPTIAGGLKAGLVNMSGPGQKETKRAIYPVGYALHGMKSISSSKRVEVLQFLQGEEILLDSEAWHGYQSFFTNHLFNMPILAAKDDEHVISPAEQKVPWHYHVIGICVDM